MRSGLVAAQQPNALSPPPLPHTRTRTPAHTCTRLPPRFRSWAMELCLSLSSRNAMTRGERTRPARARTPATPRGDVDAACVRGWARGSVRRQAPDSSSTNALTAPHLQAQRGGAGANALHLVVAWAVGCLVGGTCVRWRGAVCCACGVRLFVAPRPLVIGRHAFDAHARVGVPLSAGAPL